MATVTNYVYEESTAPEELWTTIRALPQVTELTGATTLVTGGWYHPAAYEFGRMEEEYSATFTGIGNNTIRELALAADSFDPVVRVQLYDTYGIQQVWRFTHGRSVYEQATAAETFRLRGGPVLREISSAPAELYSVRVAKTVLEAPRIQDSFVGITKTTTVALTDQYRLRDVATPSRYAEILDQGTFQPEEIRASLRRSEIALVAEELGWAETLSHRARASKSVFETSHPDEVLAPAQTSSAQFADTAFLDDLVLTTESGGWTTSTDSWRMTQYEGLPMNASLAVLDGTRYVGASDGLFRMAREVPVTGARFKSVWTDGGDDKLKLPRSLYLGYSSEHPLTVKMWVTRETGDVSYEYVVPAQLADSMRPGRVMLGRGLRSRYLRYEVLNTNGGYFYIDTALIDTDVSTRRI